jgi:hypothetical protein
VGAYFGNLSVNGNLILNCGAEERGFASLRIVSYVTMVRVKLSLCLTN